MKKLDETWMNRHKKLLEYTIRDGNNQTQDNYYAPERRFSLQEDDPVEQGYNKRPDAQAAQPPVGDTGGAPLPANPDPTEQSGVPVPDMVGDPANDVNNNTPAQPEAAPVAGEAAPETAEVQPSEEPIPEAKDDIMAELIKVHSTQIDEVKGQMGDVMTQIQNLMAQIQAVPELQTSVSSLQTQVKELTPDSPIEHLTKMVDIVGGERLDQHWNQYFKDHGQPKEVTADTFYSMKNDADTSGAEKPKEVYLDPETLPELSSEQAQKSFMANVGIK